MELALHRLTSHPSPPGHLSGQQDPVPSSRFQLLHLRDPHWVTLACTHTGRHLSSMSMHWETAMDQTPALGERRPPGPRVPTLKHTPPPSTAQNSPLARLVSQAFDDSYGIGPGSLCHNPTWQHLQTDTVPFPRKPRISCGSLFSLLKRIRQRWLMCT